MDDINITLINRINNEEESSTGSIILVLSSSVLISCLFKIILVKYLYEKINLSFYIVVLLLGFLIGIVAIQIKGGFRTDHFLLGEHHLSKISPHLIYYIFLPIIIFDSSFNAHFHIVKQQIMTTILVAVPSVLISTLITALVVVYLFPSDYRWSWIKGLLFGSILSTTDSTTIVPMLQDCGASYSLSSLIGSESLLNDGIVFMLYVVLTRIEFGTSYTMTDIVGDTVRYGLGGPLFGLVCGFICVLILNRINNELKIEITATFGVTYLVFYIADVELHLSAVLSLISMGLYMAKHKYCISSNVQSSMTGAWQIIIFVVNILIFTISGLILAHSFVGIETYVSSRDIGISLVLYLLIHVSRALIVAVLHPVITWSGIFLNRKECVIFAWSGLRGRTALILVLLFYLDPKIDRATRERFLFHISMIVFYTLTINGTSSKFLVRMLGLHKGTPESQSVLLQALKHVRTQTSKQIQKMKEDMNFANVDWKLLHDYLPDKLIEEFDEEHDANIQGSPSMISRKTLFDPSVLSISAISDKHSHQQTSDQISTNTIFQFDLNSMSDDQFVIESFLRPRTNIELSGYGYRMSMRHEIIKRFLTAMAVDYEKQWYLGMIRRRTLKILLETVEQAKSKLSLNQHWQLLVEHFCMPFYLKCLVKLNTIKCFNWLTEKFLFDHLVLTIELTLAFHSAKSHLQNMLIKFPELSNIDNDIISNVLREAKMLQLRASLVLHDLQHSYKHCWTIEMTKRCAQMLLKYESVAVVQLYETGMLNENEYTHILQFIQKKLFHLEYGYIRGTIKIPFNREQDCSLNHISLFINLSNNERYQFDELLQSRRKCFQPGEILLRQGHPVSEAYLIICGIVQCSEDLLTCYRSGHIIGIDLLFDNNSTLSNRTYRAESSIVQAYGIDENLLRIFISNCKMTRLIYNEIALHMLINMYRQPIHLMNYSQIKVLLDEYALFYRSEIDYDLIRLQLKRNQRLFLLKGKLQREDDDYFIVAPQILIIDRTTSFYSLIDQPYVAYTWTLENEEDCLQIVRSFAINFQMNDTNHITTDSTMPYPSYSGHVGEIMSQHHSLIQVARSAACASNIQLIPMEIIDLNDEYI